MKKSVLIGSIIFLIGVIIFSTAFAFMGYDISKISTKPPLEKKSIVFDNTNQLIKVNDDNTKFVIKKSEDDKIHIDYYESNKENYSINGSEFIKTNNYLWYDYLINFDFTSSVFTVSLPENYNGNIEISDKNGDFKVENISCGNIILTTNNGSIELSKVKSKDINFETKNGRITARNIEANNLKAYTKSGPIKTEELSISGNLSMNSKNGDISLTNLLPKGDIDLKTKNGGITGTLLCNSNVFSIKSHTKNGSNNLPSDFGNGNQNLFVTTSNGNIKIDFQP